MDLMITHLLFVDDLTAFFNGDEDSERWFKKVLTNFAMSSDLQVNNQKRQIFVQVWRKHDQRKLVRLFKSRRVLYQ